MDAAADLATYEQQLGEINDALTLDPERQDLLDLKSELENLIALTKELVAQHQPQPPAQQQKQAHAAPAALGEQGVTSAAKGKAKASDTASPLAASAATSASTASSATTTAAPAKPAKETYKFASGDDCLARYKADGKWYPARITSIGGSSLNTVYSVVFKGYNNTEQVTSAEIKPTKEQLEALERKRSAPGGSAYVSPEEEARIAAKKRKTEKKVERLQSKATEAKEKQQAWQKFANKGAKKGYSIAGATGKSMFRTPDDPLAKVGVVGAGRGMSSVAQRQKHIYDQKP